MKSANDEEIKRGKIADHDTKLSKKVSNNQLKGPLVMIRKNLLKAFESEKIPKRESSKDILQKYSVNTIVPIKPAVNQRLPPVRNSRSSLRETIPQDTKEPKPNDEMHKLKKQSVNDLIYKNMQLMKNEEENPPNNSNSNNLGDTNSNLMGHYIIRDEINQEQLTVLNSPRPPSQKSRRKSQLNLKINVREHQNEYSSIKDVLHFTRQYQKALSAAQGTQNLYTSNNYTNSNGNYLSSEMMQHQSSQTNGNEIVQKDVLVANGTVLASNQIAKPSKESDTEMDKKIKDDFTFAAHGNYYRFAKESLSFLSNKNSFRKMLVWLITWKYFESFIVFIILINSIFLGMYDYKGKNTQTQSLRNKIVTKSEPIFTALFTIEAVLKIVAMGLIFDKGTYLRDPWNWLDFCVVLTSLLAFLPQFSNVSGIRTFRLFRPLRSLTQLPNMKILISTLLESISYLGGILLLSLFFFVVFSILGVSLWSGAINYRCRTTPQPVDGIWPVVSNDFRLCDPQGNGRSCGQGSFCGSLEQYYLDCMNQVKLNCTQIDKQSIGRDVFVPQLNYGYTNFNNIGSALLTIFQCITQEGWSKIMYIYQDAYVPWFVSVYFILLIIICSFFILNLTIAVMLYHYKKFENDSVYNQYKKDLLNYGNEIGLPIELSDFLLCNANIRVTKKINHQNNQAKVMSIAWIKQKFQLIYRKFFNNKKIIVIPSDSEIDKRYYSHKVYRYCYYLTKSQKFNTFIMSIDFANLLLLLFVRIQLIGTFTMDIIQFINFLFILIYLVEQGIKILGYGPRTFFRNKFMRTNFLIVVISFAELYITKQPSALSVIKSFSLYRLCNVFKDGNLVVLFNAIQFTISTIGNYLILLVIFIYVYSLLGMQFFAGQLYFNPVTGKQDFVNGLMPKSNFDSFLWSFVTVFSLMLDYRWNEVMYHCIESSGYVTVLYFITLILFGNIIMINLFLAILIGNFQRARHFQQKKKVFDKFKKQILLKQGLYKSIDNILGDLSPYVKNKILKQQENSIQQSANSLLEFKLIVKEDRHQDPINGNNSAVQGQHSRDSAENKELGDLQQQQIQQQGFSLSRNNNGTDNRKSISQDYQTGLTKVIDEYGGASDSKALNNQNDRSVMKEFQSSELVGYYAGAEESFYKSSHQIQEVDEDREISNFSQSEYSKNSPNKTRQIQSSSQLDSYEIDNQHHIDRPLSQFGKRRQKLVAANRKPKTFKFQKSQTFQEVVDDLQSKNEIHLNELDPMHSFSKNDEQPEKNAIPSDSMSLDQFSQQMFQNSFVGKARQVVSKHLATSSLFIFRKQWKIRKICIYLAIPYNKELDKSEHLKKSQISTYNNTTQFNQSVSLTKGDEINNKNTNSLRDKSQIISKKSSILKLRPIQTIRKDKNRTRILRKKLSKYFENSVLILILMSSILLAIDSPLTDPHSYQTKILFILNSAFTLAFTIEAIIKIIALGFFVSSIKRQTGYIVNLWNILDFFVVIASILDFYFYMNGGSSTKKLKSIKSLRALRALRPLRMINRNEGLKVIVNALISSFTTLSHVIIVSLFFLLVFGIIGVKFMMGEFYYCDIASLADGSYIKTEETCLSQQGHWLNQPVNFDSIDKALLALFQMIFQQGWLDIMYQAISVSGVDIQPQSYHKVYLVVYFIFFMVIGSLFIQNLFTAIIIDNFNKIKRKQELGGIVMTNIQKDWIEANKIMYSVPLRAKFKQPTSKIRKFFHTIVTHKFFEYTIFLIIFMNTVIMAMKYQQMNPRYSRSLDVCNNIFTIIFNLECIFKITGLGKVYFGSSWNFFDFAVVIGTDVGFMIGRFSKVNISTEVTVIRAFRIIKIFNVIKSKKSIQIIMDTLGNIMSQIANISLLLILAIFIYSVLGISLFAGVAYGDHYNDDANFRSIGNALLILVRCGTGENWQLIMHELAQQGTQCVSGQSYESMMQDGINGCGSSVAYPFFVSYMIIIQLVILNLSVATVIEGLETSRKEHNGFIMQSDIEKLIELWQHYDPQATGWIDINELIFMLQELPSPFFLRDKLGKYDGSDAMYNYLKKEYEKRDEGGNQATISQLQNKFIINYRRNIYMPKLEALKIYKEFDFPIYDNKKVHYKDVCTFLVGRLFGDQLTDCEVSEQIQKKLNREWKQRFLTLKKHKIRQNITASTQFAAGILLEWLRKFKKNTQFAKPKRRRHSHQKKQLPKSSNKSLADSIFPSNYGQNQDSVYQPSQFSTEKEKLKEPSKSKAAALPVMRSTLPDNSSYNWYENTAVWLQDENIEAQQDSVVLRRISLESLGSPAKIQIRQHISNGDRISYSQGGTNTNSDRKHSTFRSPGKKQFKQDNIVTEIPKQKKPPPPKLSVYTKFSIDTTSVNRKFTQKLIISPLKDNSGGLIPEVSPTKEYSRLGGNGSSSCVIRRKSVQEIVILDSESSEEGAKSIETLDKDMMLSD